MDVEKRKRLDKDKLDKVMEGLRSLVLSKDIEGANHIIMTELRVLCSGNKLLKKPKKKKERK